MRRRMGERARGENQKTRCADPEHVPVGGTPHALKVVASARERMSLRLLDAVSRAQSQFITASDASVVFGDLLGSIVSLTDSEYGFIGEVTTPAGGEPYLRTHAISNIAWNDETRAFYESGAAAGLEFRNLKTLFGAVITGRSPVIANDPTADPRRGGLPEGHPPLRAFLGLPILHGGQLVGMAGLANRPGGYDEDVVEYLQPLLASCGNLIDAYRNDQRRRLAEEAREEEAEISAALARVGQDMIAALDSPALLERLCQVTAEALECDSSTTLLWRPEEDAYVPGAQHGVTPEEQEVARLVKVPRAVMAVLLSRLDHDDVAQVGTIPDDVLSSEKKEELGVALQICMALRRGKEIIGVHTAMCRRRTDPFTPKQWRIARGIAQLASLVLAHAKVVDEIERVSRLKSEFVATMSHELRTPLNVIIGYNDLLLDGLFGELGSEQAHTLRQVERNATHLLELINATLDLSRLEAGHVPLEVGDVVVPDLVAEIDIETRALRENPGVQFTWDVSPDLPRLHTDGLKLKVIIKNLIGNAMKFTSTGYVTVTVRECCGGVEFTVADTGIGIAPDLQGIIFEPFRQVDGSSTRRFGGVGLGLYIVRRLADVLGGTVTLESELGQGSTFRFSVPADIAARS